MTLTTSKEDLIKLVKSTEAAVQQVDSKDIFENEAAYANALKAAQTLVNALEKPTDVAMRHVFEVLHVFPTCIQSPHRDLANMGDADRPSAIMPSAWH